LFLEGVLGAHHLDDQWRVEPKGRTLDELCIVINRWFSKRGASPELVGMVDVSVERDRERQRSFVRAREEGEKFQQGVTTLAREDFVRLLEEAGWNLASRELREH
jgi:hypothetical protein